MHLGAGPRGELFGDIATFQSGDDMKAARPHHPGNLLHSDIGVAAQVGNVPAVVLVGEDQAAFQPFGLQGRIDAPGPLLELLFFN